MRNHVAGRIAFLRILGFVVLAATASSSKADGHDVDPAAMARASIAHLEGASSISADIHVAEEAVLSSGLKIKALREGKVLLQRTEGKHGFLFSRKGALLDQSMSYDGERLYMVGHTAQASVSIAATGNLDEVMDNMIAAGAYLPGRDLLYTDAAAGLLEDVLDSSYGGLMPVNGRACHYLTFRGPDVDWHLWVDAETELPCRYQVTSKWLTAAPEFEMLFSNWNLNKDVDTSKFKLSSPEEYQQASEFKELQPENS
jgi:hypothetical protein